MALIAKWADKNLAAFGDKVAQLNRAFPNALPRIVNQVGQVAKNRVVANLTQQTGLKRGVIARAVGNPQKAKPGILEYHLVARGGNVRLKFLSPRETRAGVTAAPWGQRRLYPSTFMKGGQFPRRVPTPKLQGSVWARSGSSNWRREGAFGVKITQRRSGMFIPDELTSGKTLQAFEQAAGPMLQERVETEFARLMG